MNSYKIFYVLKSKIDQIFNIIICLLILLSIVTILLNMLNLFNILVLCMIFLYIVNYILNIKNNKYGNIKKEIRFIKRTIIFDSNNKMYFTYNKLNGILSMVIMIVIFMLLIMFNPNKPMIENYIILVFLIAIEINNLFKKNSISYLKKNINNFDTILNNKNYNTIAVSHISKINNELYVLDLSSSVSVKLNIKDYNNYDELEKIIEKIATN